MFQLAEREGEEGLVSETEDLQQEGLGVDVFELVERVGWVIQLEGYGKKGLIPETMVVSHRMTAVSLFLQVTGNRKDLHSHPP